MTSEPTTGIGVAVMRSFIDQSQHRFYLVFGAPVCSSISYRERRSSQGSLRPQAKEGQQVREVNQTLGLGPFFGGQEFAPVLSIKQGVQPGLDPARQPEAREIVGEFELDGSCGQSVSPLKTRLS